jgi:hypothetical protein
MTEAKKKQKESHKSPAYKRRGFMAKNGKSNQLDTPPPRANHRAILFH